MFTTDARSYDSMAATREKEHGLPSAPFLNRELSQLDLIRRVLELAADESEPLLERVRFCGIVSTILDEFFMVRVSGLQEQVLSGTSVRGSDGRTPQQTLDEIRTAATDLTSAQSRLWQDELGPALAAEGILVGSVADATEDELSELEDAFSRQIFPVLTPLAVGPGQPFPYISGLSLSLGLQVRDPELGEERFARVKVPEGLDRFVSIGDRGLMIPLENVIGHYLDRLFPEMEVAEQVAFRLTRDGDTEISDDADDLLEAVESEVRKRRFGAVVRIEVSDTVSLAMLGRLEERLGVAGEHVYPIHGLLDLGDLIQLYTIDRPDLKYEPWLPYTQRRLMHESEEGLFQEIARRDILVQHPYDSFATSVEAFVQEAADDPQVVTLKTTVYRTSRDSAIAPALIKASESAKQAVCVVELKARFDEQRNIEWARALEQAGVHVVYGLLGLKTHCKTCLVVRREGSAIRRYCHIGTGNYNSKTARLYEDVGLLTASPELGADLTDLFNSLTGYSRKLSYRNLLVAPHGIRSGIIERVEREIAAHQERGGGRIRLKMNALVDEQVIDALYRASQAGVRVEIVVRGICALRPGAEGFSENILVRSILGRFLEHSRIIHFRNINEFWIGSADMMHRNLDRRVEVLAQVKDPKLTAQLDELFESALDPATRCWELRADGQWTAMPHDGRTVRDHQESLMERHRST
jgi:polyphosphate kinase